MGSGRASTVFPWRNGSTSASASKMDDPSGKHAVKPEEKRAIAKGSPLLRPLLGDNSLGTMGRTLNERGKLRGKDLSRGCAESSEEDGKQRRSSCRTTSEECSDCALDLPRQFSHRGDCKDSQVNKEETKSNFHEAAEQSRTASTPSPGLQSSGFSRLSAIPEEKGRRKAIRRSASIGNSSLVGSQQGFSSSESGSGEVTPCGHSLKTPVRGPGASSRFFKADWTSPVTKVHNGTTPRASVSLRVEVPELGSDQGSSCSSPSDLALSAGHQLTSPLTPASTTSDVFSVREAKLYRHKYEQAKAKMRVMESNQKKQAEATFALLKEMRQVKEQAEEQLEKALEELKVYQVKLALAESNIQCLEAKLKEREESSRGHSGAQC